MSSSIIAASSNTRIPIAEDYYTGTVNQPDVVSIFLKSKQGSGEVKSADEQIANAVGYSPLKFHSAILRIEKAVKTLFQEFAQGTWFKENSEFWNAFKNFSRGIIQLVPFIGNAALYLYDLARISFSIHPKIKADLSNQQDVLGIAFDGKPVFMVPLSTVKSSFNLAENTDEKEILATVNFTWLALKERFVKDHTSRELAEKFLHPYILNGSFPNSSGH